MKVLVTGGCGFIGVHACEFFCRQGWAVIAYDNMTKFELDRTGYRADAARDYNWNWLGELGVERVIGDIRDLEQILDCSSGCDFIVHTAAQPAVTISIEEPLVVHAPCADLNHVGELGNEGDVVRGHGLGHDSHPELVPNLAHDFEAGPAEALEAVGRRPWLEGSTPKEHGPRPLNRQRRLDELLRALDRARAGDDPNRLACADRNARDRHGPSSLTDDRGGGPCVRRYRRVY